MEKFIAYYVTIELSQILSIFTSVVLRLNNAYFYGLVFNVRARGVFFRARNDDLQEQFSWGITFSLKVNDFLLRNFSFDQLDLPQSESYEKLREMLLLAVRERTEGFGSA
ncbi:unnamed protein product [Toxocara canis]|uniref:HECT domain-containing protein n=1 Tax=Toxocara canis TaxID=6265 RepID=A0A183U446_TOXCA|nr:unnamed protein product [Toxocara canis]